MSHSPKSTSSADLADSYANTTLDSSTHIDNHTDAYSETYFDALYNDNTDPWEYQTRWYEKRKRDICLAILPQAEYNNAIELGSGNGVFSELLTQRCQTLTCVDGNHQAVALAKQRLTKHAHTKMIQGIIPNTLLNLQDALLKAYPLSEPEVLDTHNPPFDLIVISEILYYLSPTDIDKVIAWSQQNLAIGGTILFCHWRYSIDGFVMTGETVHQRLHQTFHTINDKETPQATFNHQSQIVDCDFLLDVWQRSPRSVAMQENLI
ncbi:class I SAM-dependent DNA methyltransferase [Psychrobacter sp. 1U1]|uniref:class I SAM-dependent DNA methyltransferase n=2 Tax=unclassified Psychrobacter TaxID=196806 RepID=UPI003F44E3D3